MDAVMTALLQLVMGVIGTLLPAIGIPDAFFTALDGAFVVLIGLLQGASWFLPLDTLVLCFTTMIVVDNFALVTKIVRWIGQLIRG